LGLPESHALHERIGKNDIGLLVFGGALPNGVKLRDATNIAFPANQIKSEWRKAGIYPFTRAALSSGKIRHKVTTANEDSNMDPKSAYLKTLQELNDTCCPILDAFGYDGRQFRVLPPV
jgi:hypothetical protein